MYFKLVSYPVRGLKCPVTVDNIVVRVIVVVKAATNSNMLEGRGLIEGNFSSLGKKGPLNLHAPPSFLFLLLSLNLLFQKVENISLQSAPYDKTTEQPNI